MGQSDLLFVQCTCMMITRDDLVVANALLGRFLPRLGPLVQTGGRLFFKRDPSLSRQTNAPTLFSGHIGSERHQPLRQIGEVG